MGCAQNLKRYPLYVGASNLLFWVPIFFLYQSSLLSLSEVLLLESVYYVAVVACEVPSGIFSDKVGRRTTLMIANLFGAASGACFLLPGFWPDRFPLFWTLLGAQILMAAWAAFRSGTESALLYDSLCAENREDEYLAFEARAETILRLSIGAACIIGGLLASYTLAYPYLAFALAQGVAFCVALSFKEPPAKRTSVRTRSHMREAWNKPVVRWVFLFAAFMTVIDHVPFEFLQSYVGFLLEDQKIRAPLAPTPIAAGLLMAACMFIAALFSSWAHKAQKRFGAVPLLLATLLLQMFIIGMMALVLHPLVAGLLMFRSVSPALHRPISLSIIQPRIKSEVRATLLSMQSFLGRLGFGASLFLVSLTSEGVLSFSSLSTILFAFWVLALVGFVALYLSRPEA